MLAGTAFERQLIDLVGSGHAVHVIRDENDCRGLVKPTEHVA